PLRIRDHLRIREQGRDLVEAPLDLLDPLLHGYRAEEVPPWCTTSVRAGTRVPALGSLAAALLVVALAEPLPPPRPVNQLLLAGEERMARGADLYVNLRLRRAGLERVPARAVDGGGLIVRVNAGFHENIWIDVRRARSRFGTLLRTLARPGRTSDYLY